LRLGVGGSGTPTTATGVFASVTGDHFDGSTNAEKFPLYPCHTNAENLPLCAADANTKRGVMTTYRIYYTDHDGNARERVMEFSSYTDAEAWLRAIGAICWKITDV
jgi:hypothetical protein